MLLVSDFGKVAGDLELHTLVQRDLPRTFLSDTFVKIGDRRAQCASILNPRVADADDEPAAVNTAREWSDGELNELGNMLVRGLTMEEISRLLRRDHGEVQDKVVEIGRVCR